MSFFQNLFNVEFRGNWVINDKQLSPVFICPRNAGRGDEIVVAWNEPTYNLSTNDSNGDAGNNLNIVYTTDDDNYRRWATLTVDLGASVSDATAVTPTEIVGQLNSNATFSELFIANLGKFSSGKDRIKIRQIKDKTKFRFYIDNGSAEDKIKFNGRAGVGELPTYFERHTIANRYSYPVSNDGLNMLILMEPSTNGVHQGIIDNAVDETGVSKGFSYLSIKEDYQLLAGRSKTFTFKKQTIDGSNRITQIIEYPAGAVAGDLAKKTSYTYTSTNTYPDQVTEEPHTLESGDLVTP